ncbi:hypothetical protein BJ970_002736 [Saccharopolyspora phatthalungensis]|uniref:DUF5919 domain-containing protein n=2 Tax=Saccharopolyspora phatthalungensis TaxID=664693 RepID=A0A840PY49_9PSEU|nr:hypothetical protein [Saccharopolyspora phatthalungensis]
MGLTPDQVAETVGVDRKTVERWITKGRNPYPKYRYAVAAMVRESESYLWPDAVPTERKTAVAESELVQMYPHRNSVPVDLWNRLIRDASATIEILVHAGLFLIERPTFIKHLIKKAENGTNVRLLFGDPDSDEVELRSEEEQLGEGTLGSRIRNALAFYRPTRGVTGIELRLHTATLYNSIFRFDDEMIVNTHIYGFQGAYAPALHLRQLSAGGLFEIYSESFEAVWGQSKPADLWG